MRPVVEERLQRSIFTATRVSAMDNPGIVALREALQLAAGRQSSAGSAAASSMTGEEASSSTSQWSSSAST